jgi:hypothetical protein
MAMMVLHYESYEHFISQQNLLNFPFDKFFEKVFSEAGRDRIFVDISNRRVLVEKNYLAATLQQMIKENGQRKFKEDFLAPRATDIFDSNKMSVVLDCIDRDKYFHRFGAQKKKVLQKILFTSVGKKEEYRVGWFGKIDMSADAAISYFLKNYLDEKNKIQVITDSAKEIDARSKNIKNLIETN